MLPTAAGCTHEIASAWLGVSTPPIFFVRSPALHAPLANRLWSLRLSAGSSPPDAGFLVQTRTPCSFNLGRNAADLTSVCSSAVGETSVSPPSRLQPWPS